jgi:hypothetical protein
MFEVGSWMLDVGGLKLEVGGFEAFGAFTKEGTGPQIIMILMIIKIIIIRGPFFS